MPQTPKLTIAAELPGFEEAELAEGMGFTKTVLRLRQDGQNAGTVNLDFSAGYFTGQPRITAYLPGPGMLLTVYVGSKRFEWDGTTFYEWEAL